MRLAKEPRSQSHHQQPCLYHSTVNKRNRNVLRRSPRELSQTSQFEREGRRGLFSLSGAHKGPRLRSRDSVPQFRRVNMTVIATYLTLSFTPEDGWMELHNTSGNMAPGPRKKAAATLETAVSTSLALGD